MKKEKKKKLPYLDYACKVGERVRWENIQKQKFEGTLVKMGDHFIATVKLDDGTEIEVQC
jgi:hypothetical protein